jgi:hypothetical protein
LCSPVNPSISQRTRVKEALDFVALPELLQSRFLTY